MVNAKATTQSKQRTRTFDGPNPLQHCLEKALVARGFCHRMCHLVFARVLPAVERVEQHVHFVNKRSSVDSIFC